MIVLEHRIHSGSRCAIKCEFRHIPEGKLSDFSTADIKHGFSVGQTHGSNIKKIIYGVPILEHKISGCVTFAVECKFNMWKEVCSTMQLSSFSHLVVEYMFNSVRSCTLVFIQ